MAAHWEGGSGGKGSAPRNMSITQEEYDNRWDLIFGRDKKKEQKEDDESSSSNTDNRQQTSE